MKYFIILFLSLIYGCDPGYSVYIKNQSNEILILKTIPSIESLYDKHTLYYDSIVNHKINIENNLSIYQIRPNEKFKIFGHIGVKPELNEIPFTYIEIISAGDTTILNTKEKIIESLKKEKTKKYIIIR